MGGVLHTLNLRLHPDELAYIVNHADDRAVLVDESLLPLWEQVRPKVNVPTTIVVGATRPVPDGDLDYEALIARAEPATRSPGSRTSAPPPRCATPPARRAIRKACSTRTASLVLHTLGLSLDHCMGIREHDVVLPVVPMFHANAWGMPFSSVMVGAKLVMPGPHLDPASLVDLFHTERVTLTGGVPTIWMGVLQYLDANPGKFDLSSIRAMYVGGSAVPQAMIEAFEQRHGLHDHPGVGDDRDGAARDGRSLSAVDGGCERRRQVRLPRQAGAPGAVRRNPRAQRGRPGAVGRRRRWASSRCAGRGSRARTTTAPTAADRFTDDGWFRTGDIVTIDGDATIQVQDRTKDLIKSGGEWISSVALECALMGHPAVAEAAVIPVREREVVRAPARRGGAEARRDRHSRGAARRSSRRSFSKFWLPDDFEFIDAIPRTSAGKFKKSALRERFKDYQAAE